MGKYAIGFATGGKRPGAGRKPFIPTDDQRAKVAMLARCGVKYETICREVLNPKTLKAINEKTLRKAFEEELKEGNSIAEARLIMKASAIAKGSDAVALRSVMFLLHCKFGWREATLETPAPTQPKEVASQIREFLNEAEKVTRGDPDAK